MATCDATILDRIAQGVAASPVSSTTAADVSSHEVSMPRMRMGGVALLLAFLQFCRPDVLERALERFRIRRSENAFFSDDAGDQTVRCDIEPRVPDFGAGRSDLRRPDVRDLARA